MLSSMLSFQVMAKIEKPQAVDDLEAIVGLCDAIMVARCVCRPFPFSLRLMESCAPSSTLLSIQIVDMPRERERKL